MSVQDKRTQNRRRLQSLLRELFQFDYADLDFGIYRILNQKRDDIERFIERDLLDAVEQGLAHFQTAEREKLEKTMAEKRAKLVPQAFGKDGRVIPPFNELPDAKEYTRAWLKLEQIEISEETEARVFNDLWRFFSRYYDNGDFLTERRYSSREPKFYVPYNGEEVLLHWANRDQYYVKTSERFTDYRFTAGDYAVWFRLQHAEVEQDNVKGDKRQFVLRTQAPLDYDAEARTLTVFFEYRPITEEEEARYLATYNAQQSRSSRRKTLDRRALCMALEVEILAGLDDANLKTHLAAVPGGRETAPLGHHLNQYTARNTMDYFVHKDLGGFLRRELDFFLKNEVLRIDDVIGDESGEAMPHVLTRVRVVRQIGDKIIAFLAQIEDFQKRLFEKKKFVVQTDYCVTLDRVPEALYPDILANEAQLDEWQRLYNVAAWENDLFWQGEFDEAFLASHPYAMVDTAFFDGDFKARLLASFEDLDGATDGVLIHGENFQALNLLMEKYREQVKCIYIDPPYNIGNDDFLYKDNYQHSTWATLVKDRLELGRQYMTRDGTLVVSIDDVEFPLLLALLKAQFGIAQQLATLVWDRNRKNDASFFSVGHEYMVVFARDKDLLRGSGVKFRELKAGVDEAEAVFNRLKRKHKGDWEQIREEWNEYVRSLKDYETKGVLVKYPKIGPRGPYRDDGNINWPGQGGPRYTILHPTSKKPVKLPKSGWRYSTAERFWEEFKKGKIAFGSDETTVPGVIYYLFESNEQVMGSVFWSYAQTAFEEFNALFGERVFENPKNWRDIQRICEYLTDSQDIILDFFAGSGTTAHAVVNLNRDDDVTRKYVLVEMGDHFDAVLKPRIQKVTFSTNWKNGIPQDRDGTSHVVKYQRIESYEDALNNVRVRQPEGAQRRLLYEEFGDYQLHYMLDFETRDSPTLLAPQAFETPFSYTLKIQRGHESPRDTVVDLVETFHYLTGMHVHRRERHEHQGRPYAVSRGEVRTERGVETVVVIWRDTAGLDLEREADWANGEDGLFTGPVDRVYVNGPSFIQQAEPLEIVFRQRMDVKE